MHREHREKRALPADFMGLSPVNHSLIISKDGGRHGDEQATLELSSARKGHINKSWLTDDLKINF